VQSVRSPGYVLFQTLDSYRDISVVENRLIKGEKHMKRIRDAGVKVTSAFLLITLLTVTGLAVVSADDSSDTYSMVIVQGETQMFRLETNPTTGLLWRVESVPSNVVVKETGSEAGTLSCLKEEPPPPGCGQVFQVFSISSNVPGDYVIEFRLGHPGAAAQYYRIAYLKLSVKPGQTGGNAILDMIVGKIWEFLNWLRCIFWNCSKQT